MKKIAHISDLHFGTEDPTIALGLLNDLAEFRPDIVAVSGDLTQRARHSEFIAARDYLAQIPAPKIVVPGNHDIPLYNVLRRWLAPLENYQEAITRDMHPLYVDDEIALAGVNTARSDTWKEGRVSTAQIERLRVQFSSVPAHLAKVLVCHHPFIPPEHSPEAAVVGRVRRTLRMLTEVGCGVILSGHLHRVSSGDARPYHIELARSVLVFQAGTAISQRRRNEPNAYNRLQISPTELELEVRQWDGSSFVPVSQKRYQHHADGWAASKIESR
jgi:3',5'-cyclic AMP phosphodiesterase CpdA